MAKSKSCLVITYGPVPTSEFQTVEGGGMRAWGLAKGIQSHGLDVTVGVNNSFPQNISSHQGIRLVNWGLDADFTKLINSFDAVVISYCMGDPSVYVAEYINDSVQLILDCYVPIYIEVSARDSKDTETEYINYMADIKHFNLVLKRGDYFLYANDAQELMYSGILGALGVINPHTYRQHRLIKTPFGIHRDEPPVAKSNPYKALDINDSDFVVLWFGGIYPWFNIDEYLAAIKDLSSNKTLKFVFVGGKNPFNPNPDFSRQYELAVSFAEKNKLINKQVFFVDWVNFNDRVNWYERADIVISLNRPGDENRYSWRTRVVDYVWGGLTILSNGMDPLSEELIAAGAAIRLPELTAESIKNSILSTQKNPKQLQTLQRNIKKVQQKYFWDITTQSLADIINKGELPYLNERPFAKKVGHGNELLSEHGLPIESTASKLVGLPFKVVHKVKQKGLVRTAKVGVNVVRTQLKNRPKSDRLSRFIFISHPINSTGAPIVLIQMVEEFVKRYGANRVRVLAPGAEPEQRAQLKKIGVSLEHTVFGVGFRFVRLQLGLKKDDFVLLNTAAVYDNYRDFILLWLKTGRLKHATWFIHEDLAQLPYIHKEFFEESNLRNIRQLMDSHKLSVLVPSKRTGEEYAELLTTNNIRPIKLHVEVADKYKHPRPVSDYKQINFLLSGTPADGRKGQLLALAAFEHFVQTYYHHAPDKYRDFKLHLVAIGEDYISQQIKWVADSLLKERSKIYPSLPKDKALEITTSCNAVICCSLNETFGLYVAEGMLMGHIVLRNNSAGIDEQLKDGVNGYFIDHTDITKFSAVIEKVLNKNTTTNVQLQKMGLASQKMMKDYTNNSYLYQINQLD